MIGYISFYGETYRTREWEAVMLATDSDGDQIIKVRDVCSCAETCTGCRENRCPCFLECTDNEDDHDCQDHCDCDVPATECDDDENHVLELTFRQALIDYDGAPYIDQFEVMMFRQVLSEDSGEIV